MYFPRCPILIVLSTSIGLAFQAPVQEAPISQGDLEYPGAREVRLAAGATHRWLLSLEAGEFAQIDVTQQQIDAIARLFAPGEALLVGYDLEPAGSPSERIIFVADEPGTYTLEILAESEGQAGLYRIDWVVRRTATQQDREVAGAYLAYYEARRLAGRKQFEEARMRAASAVSLFQQSLEPEDRRPARANQKLGYAFQDAGDLEGAEAYLKESLRLRETVLGPEHPDVADALDDLATLYWDRWELDRAEPLFLRALQIREKTPAPDKLDLAGALNDLATLYWDQGKLEQAEPLYLRVLELRETALGPEDTRVANVLNDLGSIYRDLARYEDAEPALRRSLAILEKANGPEHPAVATVLNNLGNLASDRGRNEEAASMHRRALEIREKVLGLDHSRVASSLDSLAFVYLEQGRYSDTEPLLRRALDITERSGPESPDTGMILNRLADLLVLQGRFPEAESLYRRGLDIMRLSLGPDHANSGFFLSDLADLYSRQGNYGEAEPLYRQATAILEKALGPEHPGLAGVWNNWAILKRHQARFAEAETLYRKVVQVYETVHGPDHPAVGQVLLNLAALSSDQEDYPKAEELARRSLAILQAASGPEDATLAAPLKELANLARLQGRLEEAEQLHRRALAVREKAGGPDYPDVAESLSDLAQVLMDQGRAEEARPLLDRSLEIFDATTGKPELRIDAYARRASLHHQQQELRAAIRDLEEALGSAEELRPQVGGDEETRASFFKRYSTYYDWMVSWLLEAARIEDALEYAERGRARVLLDQLTAGKIDLRSGIPEQILEPLEKRESEVKSRLAEYLQRISLLRSSSEIPAQQRGQRLSELTAAARQAEQDFRAIYSEIKNASPLWRDLITSGGQPIGLSAIQRRLVPDRGLLLLYQIGSEQSHLFLVPPMRGEARAFPLKVDETSARSLGLTPGPLTNSRLQEALTGNPEPAPGQTRSLSFVWGLTKPQSTLFIDELERLYALFSVLAPAEVRSEILSASQVLLIPDGALHLIPFEALLLEEPGPGQEPVFWLDRGPALLYSASATSLYNILRRPASRAYGSEGVLSLADPIYDMAQVAAALRGELVEPPPAKAVDRSFSATDDSLARAAGILQRLPGTALESAEIERRFGQSENLEFVKLTQLEASEEELRAAVPGKRYLHLATHGLVGVGDRSLFSALALTPPPEATADSDNDGYLQLYEIYELKLDECEMAVLSACQTNVGRTIEGEGVFALSRGFLAAGCRRVVASQWSVDDVSTSALMGGFFGQIAEEERAGKPIDFVNALRDAKREVRNQAKWAHPYFWAPFIMTGKR